MANRFNRSIREIRDIEKQPLHTNEQNDLLSDINDDVYVRLRRRYERITGLPALEKKFNNHLMDYNQFKDDTQQMLIYLNDVNERQDMMIDKLNTDVDDLIKKSKRLKDISDEHTEKLKSLTKQLTTLNEITFESIDENYLKIEEIKNTLKNIQENDKQNKLQSEIDEVRKSLEAIKTDLEETKAIEDMKQLNQSLKNFFSVSSNVSENMDGLKDFVYFDIYSIVDNSDLNITITQQELEKTGGLSEEKTLVSDENYGVFKEDNNNHHLTVRLSTSEYKHIQIFKIKINGILYYTLQVKFSDYE